MDALFPGIVATGIEIFRAGFYAFLLLLVLEIVKRQVIDVIQSWFKARFEYSTSELLPVEDEAAPPLLHPVGKDV